MNFSVRPQIRALAFALSSSLLATACMPIVQIDAEVESLCVGVGEQLVPPGTEAVAVVFETTALSDIAAAGALEISMELEQVVLLATGGLNGLDSVRAIAVSVAPMAPESDLPPMELVRCAAGECDTADLEIALGASPAATDGALDAYVRSGALAFIVEIEGGPPQAWTMALSLCVSASARLDIGPSR